MSYKGFLFLIVASFAATAVYLTGFSTGQSGTKPLSPLAVTSPALELGISGRTIIKIAYVSDQDESGVVEVPFSWSPHPDYHIAPAKPVVNSTANTDRLIAEFCVIIKDRSKRANLKVRPVLQAVRVDQMKTLNDCCVKVKFSVPYRALKGDRALVKVQLGETTRFVYRNRIVEKPSKSHQTL